MRTALPCPQPQVPMPVTASFLLDIRFEPLKLHVGAYLHILIRNVGTYFSQLPICYSYITTRVPWAAAPALIKVDKKGQKPVQFSGKRHSVSIKLSKQQKRTFSLATSQIDEATDQSGTSLGLTLRPTSICRGAICQV